MNSDASEKQTILIVDDLPDNIVILKNILIKDYRVLAATSGALALEIAREETRPDLILLDIMMPEMSGYEVCRQLKADVRTSNIPVIFVTAMGEIEDETQGFELGAVDYITKPVSPPLVSVRVKTHLALANQQRALQDKVDEQTQELLDTQLAIIERLGHAAEYKDNETGKHVIRMSKYSYILARAAGLGKHEAKLIERAAPMHDVGKIGVPDNILQKPGRHAPEEWKIMSKHPEYGASIIGEHHSPLIKLAKSIALTHHEKWDGTGYPNGLAGTDIPIESRIVSIADVFDALTSARPYKKAWSIDNAVDYIESNSGVSFDPDLARLVRPNLQAMLEVKEAYSE